MSEEFGSDFITIIDDDGNEYELEHLDTVEFSGHMYMAFLPADVSEGDDNYGMVILKVIKEDGEEILTTIDSDAELDAVYEKFMERLFEE